MWLGVITVIFSCFAYVSSDATCGANQYYYAPANKCFFWNLQGPKLVSAKTFAAARSFCQKDGGDLVSIHSDDEDFFVSNLQSDTTPVSASMNSYIWIGLTGAHNGSSMNYSWVDGSAVNFTDFGRGRDGSRFNQTSNFYKVLTFSPIWEDTLAGDTMSPFCQRPATNVQVSTTTAAPSSANCPIGAIYSNSTNRCFKFTWLSEKWLDARTTCMYQKGDLASIHTADENQLIAAEAKRRDITAYWIGLNRAIDHSTNYTWSDASSIDYQNWNPGVPGTCSDGPQDCVSVDTVRGQWFNCWQCTQTMPSVCEVPVSQPSTLQQKNKAVKAINFYRPY